MNKKLFNSIISLLLIFSISIVSLIGCSSEKITAKDTIEAFEKNIVDSAKVPDEIFGFSKFYESLKNGTFTLTADLKAFDSKIEIAAKDNYMAKVAFNILESKFFDMFADDKELIFSSDFFDGKIYGINLEEMVKELYPNITDIKKYNKEYNEAIYSFIIDCKNEFLKILSEVPNENLEPVTLELNGKSTKVNGTKFTVTTTEIFKLAKYAVEQIENNEILKQLFAYAYYSESYAKLMNDISIDDLKQAQEKSLEIFQNELTKFKDEINLALEESAKDLAEGLIEVNAYVNNGYVVKSEILFLETDLVFKFESKGGSYPFENATFEFIDSIDNFTFKTNGENTNDIYKFGVEFNDSKDTITSSLEYNKNTKDLIFSFDDLKLNAKIEKLDIGKEFSISIPEIFAEINFINTSEITKPEGEYINFFTLTEEDLNQISENFSNSFYQFFYQSLLGM